MTKLNQDFLDIVVDILENPQVQEMKKSKHHGKCFSLYTHNISTANFTYKCMKKLHLSQSAIVSAVRAAILHDFYNDYQRFEKRKNISEMHAFYHGKIAANNAIQYFKLSESQKDAIIHHMFPLTKWPSHKEGWFLTFSDKVISFKEVTISLIFLFCTKNKKQKMIKKYNIL